MALFLFFFSLFPALPGVRGGTQPENDEECPGGAHCRGGEQSLPACPAGYFCPGGNSSVPVPCPPGTFRPAGAAVPPSGCQPCPEGFFSPRPAQSSCQPCPEGFFSPRAGQSSCQPCPEGFFNPRTGQSSCQPCPEGFFSPRPAQSSCQPCPEGFFSPRPAQSSCLPCPEGFFNPRTGQSSCQPCPEGFFNPRPAQSSCQPCPEGFFNPRTGQSSCQPCPEGFFNPRTGQSSCQPCPEGFFNPRPAQSSCLPCGSGAVQPAEGQSTCVCLGPGQVYQPRDSLCTCPPGFRSAGRDGSGCERRSHPVCRGSASRRPDGQCLTARGWARYCSRKVCADPRDFQGYDKVLGLCVCHSESLDRVCDSRCRKHQKSTLQVSCAQNKPQLLISHSNGSKTVVFLEGLRKLLPKPNFSLEDFCAAGQQTHPAHIVEMSGKGFLGVYNPDPQLIHNLLVQDEDSGQEMNPRSAAAPGPPEECREQTLSPPNTTGPAPFLGILNPIACISSNETLLFLITPEHFPLYDVNNLFNTNAEFDWGDFRSLREEIREIPRNSQKFLLFLVQFQAPGTYVLQLSSNKHKRMYLRALPLGARCPQAGPFVPCSPRAAVRAGLARARQLRLRPDWAALGALGAALLLLLAAAGALALLCRGPGWAPRGRPLPAFRRPQLRLRGFPRAVPAAFAVRKPRPELLLPAGGTGQPWEPQDQLDLEDFNTKIFFEVLLRQSQSVSTTLGHFREEVAVVYHRVLKEISSLKRLWLRALSIPGREEEEEEEEEEEKSTETKEQVPPSGSPQGFGNPPSPRFDGISKIPKDPREFSKIPKDSREISKIPKDPQEFSKIPKHPREFLPQKLIPLLQSVLQLLQENRKFNLSPESTAESHKWLMKQNQNFLHLLSNGRHSLAQKAHPGEKTLNSLSPSELEDEVDALTEELLQIAEDEEQFLTSKGNEDLLSYYLEITSLEKESLVKQIHALEEEIALGRKL